MNSAIFRVLPILWICAFLTASAGETAKVVVSAEEKKILELTNAERKKIDLPPLQPNLLLFKAARGHSENMAKKEKMEHELDGKTAADRIKDTGYLPRAGGENIGMGSPQIPVSEIFGAWMKSQYHRENILRKEFTQIGIGAAKAKNGDIYYTQVFGAPLRK
jgi:uncharacterized protein YkwD